nr:TatD family hydrolase [Bacteroidota bacterium]
MTIFADTHNHIYLDSFDEDRDEIIKRALNAGVNYMFLPNIDSSSILGLGSVVATHPDSCFPMIGLHPTSVKADYREQMGVIEMELRENRDRYCAVGEIGIDLYWDKSFASEQEDVFIRQIELALEFDLPIVIHTRNSMDLAL